MEEDKERLDIFIHKKGLVGSRKTASDLIKDEKVLVNSVVVTKPSKEIDINSKIEILELPKYVSRAGLKLEKALDTFNINVKNKIALDIGSSTGGFTDCLLQRSIQKVYAVDVGTDQLHEKIRNDSRVISMEQTDIRKLESLGDKVDFVVVDVSFISLELILPNIKRFLKDDGEVVVLVKPQFEVGKEKIGKGGIVKDEEDRLEVLEKIKSFCSNLGFKINGEIESPIKGGGGNLEFLLYLSNNVV